MTANIDVLVEKKKSDYPALPTHVTVTTPNFLAWFSFSK